MINSSSIKSRILSNIKELDKSDYYDICALIKMYITDIDNEIISVSLRGTYINLDKLDNGLLQQMDNMILTKLQRIHLNQI